MIRRRMRTLAKILRSIRSAVVELALGFMVFVLLLVAVPLALRGVYDVAQILRGWLR